MTLPLANNSWIKNTSLVWSDLFWVKNQPWDLDISKSRATAVLKVCEVVERMMSYKKTQYLFEMNDGQLLKIGVILFRYGKLAFLTDILPIFCESSLILLKPIAHSESAQKPASIDVYLKFFWQA